MIHEQLGVYWKRSDPNQDIFLEYFPQNLDDSWWNENVRWTYLANPDTFLLNEMETPDRYILSLWEKRN